MNQSLKAIAIVVLAPFYVPVLMLVLLFATIAAGFVESLSDFVQELPDSLRVEKKNYKAAWTYLRGKGGK